ncbi:MAG TPA: hypothetical protein VNR89_00825 [Roseomonas sp.]|nr:hypothetical protein [Roseomonas sp.]
MMQKQVDPKQKAQPGYIDVRTPRRRWAYIIPLVIIVLAILVLFSYW